MEAIIWSGRDVKKMPIIGIIITKETVLEIQNGKKIVFPSSQMNVVEILDNKAGIVYVIDDWYKNHTPQLVHEKCVDKYIHKEKI